MSEGWETLDINAVHDGVENLVIKIDESEDSDKSTDKDNNGRRKIYSSTGLLDKGDDVVEEIMNDGANYSEDEEYDSFTSSKHRKVQDNSPLGEDRDKRISLLPIPIAKGSPSIKRDKGDRSDNKGKSHTSNSNNNEGIKLSSEIFVPNGGVNTKSDTDRGVIYSHNYVYFISFVFISIYLISSSRATKYLSLKTFYLFEINRWAYLYKI